MSEEQALENQDDIIDNAQLENQDDVKSTDNLESTDEVEIVVEGEDQPASKAHVPIGVQKRFSKLTGKVSAANAEADQARRRSEMLEEENKLLRLQSQQGKPATRPKEDDFDTDAEYQSAIDEYDGVRIERIAEEKASQIIQASQTQAATANQDHKLQSKIEAHYGRANALKIKNFEELEDKAIDILGNDFAKTIMAGTEKSHLIMGHLGVNTGRAQELAELLKVDPIAAFAQAVELGSGLSVRPKNATAPDPETKLDPGSPASDWQKRVDMARDQASKTGDMSKLIALKRDAKDAGAKIR